MEVIFLLGSVQALFLSILIVAKQKKEIQDRFLLFWMMFLSLHLASVYFSSTGGYRIHPRWFGFDTAFLLLEGPFLFLYVQLATAQIKSLRWVHALHAVPYSFFTIYFVRMVHSYEGKDLYEYISSILKQDSNYVVIFFGLLNHLQLICYMVLSFLTLRSYQKKLENEFSYTEEINLRWLHRVVIGIGLISVFIVVGLFINDLFSFVDHRFKAYLIYTSFAILPYYLSFFAILQRVVYSQPDQLKKYEGSSLSLTESKEIAQRLEQLMKTEKPYLDGQLTLKNLAEKMNVHPKILSQTINENSKQNFFNYVNLYRVEEVKQRMQDKKYANYKIFMIGLDSGFNTKSSFNTIFKKFTGQTPSEYKSATSKGLNS
jgi:AraC-like DNA-binding protein